MHLEPHMDERGSFARILCQQEFRSAGLPREFVQASISKTRHRGTLRGLHYQRAPSAEGKVVRCLCGKIYDVILDVREKSPTFLAHFSVELSSSNGLGLYVPPGVAHGFQTLTDDVAVLYHMTDFFAPELAEGVRWNDPVHHIRWPIESPLMSARDRDYPDYKPPAGEP